MGNLKRRILTAIALLIPLIAALYLLPTVWLVPLFGIIVFAAVLEWAGLIGLRGGARVSYALIVVGLGAALTSAVLGQPALVWPVLAVAAVWWLWAFVELGRDRGLYYLRGTQALAGALVLIPMWVAAIFLHAMDPQRPLALLFVLALVWIADSLAYFAGKNFGRTKLAPRVSPGKTVEGVLGALVGVVLMAYVCGTILWQFEGMRLAAWLGLALFVTLVSVLGDLAESKVKRVAGVKDSGTLLPGHGGVLDRIDALTAAIPIFALGWLMLLHIPT
ncbi:MAG: phosphatidate cytidylyltransferase [Gammaproteobacteria bacterium]